MSSDPVDQIAAALARLRGPRPRAPWDPTSDASRPPWAHGGMHSHSHSHSHDHGPGGRQGMPPWAGGHGRFGGPARLRMLEALAAAPNPLSVSEIAEAVGVDQPRASRLVQQSVELGFVRRDADPADARRTRIALTEEGEAVLRGFRGERRGAVHTALADFSDADRAELARLLTKLAEAWPRG